MRFLHLFNRQFVISKIERADKLVRAFSPFEKLIFSILMIVFGASALTLLFKLSNQFMVEVPENGGSVKEAVVGLPRFINPLFALSDADRDLTSLIYSGLLKYRPDVGLVPDLAESYVISPDSLKYTFRLRPDLVFHDGHSLTTEDVEFTILKAQESLLKSPKRGSWDGIRIEKVNDREIVFILNQPYSPFLENTTIGILPKHLWKNIDTDQFTFNALNTEPVGSGPFKINQIARNSAGLPESYKLKAFPKYALGKPNIDFIVLNFYANEDKALKALKDGEVDNLSAISPAEAVNLDQKKIRIVETPLPRIFGVFFNQNHAPVISNKEVRQALEMSVDRKEIVQLVLKGYGSEIDSPIPPGIFADELHGPEIDRLTASTTDNIESAKKLLEKNGWKINDAGIFEKKSKKETFVLKFSIATANTNELKEVARLIKNHWERLGAQIEVKVFEPGDLSQNIIRPRKYDALLFGEIVGRDLDLFPFWHSSQRNDPGFNIAIYTNSRVDKILSEARKLNDQKDRMTQYNLFKTEIKTDIPAIFLYTPNFIYALSKDILGFQIGTINTPAERFANVDQWFLKTRKVWSQFANQNH